MSIILCLRTSLLENGGREFSFSWGQVNDGCVVLLVQLFTTTLCSLAGLLQGRDEDIVSYL